MIGEEFSFKLLLSSESESESILLVVIRRVGEAGELDFKEDEDDETEVAEEGNK